MGWYIYVLENEQGTRYVGYTGQEPEHRLAEHNAGLNRWTRTRRPWRLVYQERHESKREALQREAFLKTGAGRRLRDRLVDDANRGSQRG